MTPRQLSLRFLEAYNRRNAEALRALIDPEVHYVRMGGRVADGVDDVVAAYVASWDAGFVFELDRSTEEGDAVVIEITGRRQRPPHEVIKACDYHRWRDGRMIEYRAYVDHMDAE